MIGPIPRRFSAAMADGLFARAAADHQRYSPFSATAAHFAPHNTSPPKYGIGDGRDQFARAGNEWTTWVSTSLIRK